VAKSRRPTFKVLLVLAGVVVALAAAAVWYVVLRDDAPPPAALVERAIEPAAVVREDDLSGAWTLAPGPDVWAGYRITEHIGLLDNVAVARTGTLTAALTIDGTSITAVTAEVAMGTLVSQDTELPGVGGRADAMRTKGLETDLFPSATFILTEPIELGELPEAGTTITAAAVGTLELHGVQRPVSIPISARWSGDVIDLTGSVEVSLADHAIEPPDPQIVTVDGTGTLEFQLTFVRS